MRLEAAGVMLMVLLTVVPGSQAAVYVISPNGSGDFPTIRAAIDAAVHEDIIELTDGVFVGEDNHNLDFCGKRITVRSQSGDPECCIIDCEGNGDPDVVERGFEFYSGECYSSVIQGLTIMNGAATAT